jgi:hypothetical protein
MISGSAVKSLADLLFLLFLFHGTGPQQRDTTKRITKLTGHGLKRQGDADSAEKLKSSANCHAGSCAGMPEISMRTTMK